jgi:hypothetical protein
MKARRRPATLLPQIRRLFAGARVSSPVDHLEIGIIGKQAPDLVGAPPECDRLSYCDAADIVLPNFHQELTVALPLPVRAIAVAVETRGRANKNRYKSDRWRGRDSRDRRAQFRCR